MHHAGEQAIFATAAKQKPTEKPLQARICFGKTQRFPVKAWHWKEWGILSTPVAVAVCLSDI
jgi:hypothetical protein